jgi:acetyl-CoA synthetase
MAWVTPPGYRVYPPNLNITREVVDKQIAAGRGGCAAIVWNTGTWTYEDLNREVCRIAAGLRSIGVAGGDVVLFRSRNVPLACAAILATYKIGAVSALTSTLLREAELEPILQSTVPKAVVTLDDVADPIRKVANRHQIGKIVLLTGKAAATGELSVDEFDNNVASMPTAETSALDPAVLFYSSGTTGKPKGVVHAHRWIAAMGDVIRLQMEYSPGDIAMTPGEFSFMATWGHCFVTPLYCGATVSLYAGRPTPQAVLQAISAQRVNKFMAVPTFYRTVLANDGVEDGIDLSAVRIWVSGGEALSEATVENWRERFNIPLYDMYGITEMQVVIANSPANPQKPGSLGRLLPGIRIALRDEELKEVPPGEPGRVMVHRDDPGMFSSYHGDWDKWRAAHRGDFYDTGDVMRKDEDGYFWYLGRQDDLFKSRGMFVSPSEVEAALLRHSAVAEVAVIGVPDERIGYRVSAFAVIRSGIDRSPDLAKEILSLAAGHLANYKVPEKLAFVEALPKSVVGKILRRALREDR